MVKVYRSSPSDAADPPDIPRPDPAKKAKTNSQNLTLTTNIVSSHSWHILVGDSHTQTHSACTEARFINTCVGNSK